MQRLAIGRSLRLDTLDAIQDAVPSDRGLPVAVFLQLIGTLRSLKHEGRLERAARGKPALQ